MAIPNYLYLDTSVIVPLFCQEIFTERARSNIFTWDGPILVSDFVEAEFASAIAKKFRIGNLSHEELEHIFASADQWFATLTTRVNLSSGDIVQATSLVRRLDTGLRAPDAINLAIAMRVSATLCSFDDGLRNAAVFLQFPVL